MLMLSPEYTQVVEKMVVAIWKVQLEKAWSRGLISLEGIFEKSAAIHIFLTE